MSFDGNLISHREDLISIARYLRTPPIALSLCEKMQRDVQRVLLIIFTTFAGLSAESVKGSTRASFTTKISRRRAVDSSR